VGGPYEVVVGGLREGPVARARLAVGAWIPGEGMHMLALDADRDEWVRVPVLVGRDDWLMLALSPDGRHLVAAHRAGGGLYWYELATGHGRMLGGELRRAEIDHCAAVSPDGEQIATLSCYWDPGLHKDLTSVNVVEVAAGARRQLWATEGGWSAESGVSWAPDQRLVAATYLWEDEDDDQVGVVVVDTEGGMVGQLEYASMAFAPEGTWLNEREIVVVAENEDTGPQAWDPRAGTRRPLGMPESSCWARIGDRLIQTHLIDGYGTLRLVTINLTGGEPQPLLALSGNFGLDAVRCASALWQ
jgi:hypothetical protein